MSDIFNNTPTSGSSGGVIGSFNNLIRRTTSRSLRRGQIGAFVNTTLKNALSAPPQKNVAASSSSSSSSGYRRSSYYNPYYRSYGYSGGGSAAPLTTTTTDTRTSNVNTSEAGARINSVLQDMLGRAPTTIEMLALRAALTAHENANPTTTTSTTTKSADGTSQTSTTSVKEGASDASRQEVLKNAVITDLNMNKQMYSYQAATTYMDALMQAIDNPFAEG